MPQEPEPRTRRGFIRTAGLLAGGTAVAAAGPAQAASADATLDAGAARTLDALAGTVSALFPDLVAGPAGAAAHGARYARLSPAERERVDRAIGALGPGFAALDQQARLAHLGARLNGTRASDVETALGLLAAARTGEARGVMDEARGGSDQARGTVDEGPGAVDEARGRLLGRALRAATGARIPAAPAMTDTPFVI
ncbi:hypothetical protein FH608_018215 [Nonomuraea phyllanthi]|uniref:Uncharacterized protein n=1 Tax=Nonomuraea phyllanthi TaxID=2219224 RepID=A0A5C4WJS6_9ACTN|nr:hypothetical protein [Nonomuraea phyllanthi]KAB8194113.1 hypothetical protein FH608_018215 [Nonomuraea phyllanthi]